jgi:hypothetical protein
VRGWERRRVGIPDFPHGACPWLRIIQWCINRFAVDGIAWGMMARLSTTIQRGSRFVSPRPVRLAVDAGLRVSDPAGRIVRTEFWPAGNCLEGQMGWMLLASLPGHGRHGVAEAFSDRV